MKLKVYYKKITNDNARITAWYFLMIDQGATARNWKLPNEVKRSESEKQKRQSRKIKKRIINIHDWSIKESRERGARCNEWAVDYLIFIGAPAIKDSSASNHNSNNS